MAVPRVLPVFCPHLGGSVTVVPSCCSSFDAVPHFLVHVREGRWSYRANTLLRNVGARNVMLARTVEYFARTTSYGEIFRGSAGRSLWHLCRNRARVPQEPVVDGVSANQERPCARWRLEFILQFASETRW